jgi:hypothetical protein
VSLILLLLADTVAAAGLPGNFEDPDEAGVRICARAMGESLSDPWISSIYRPSVFTGGVGVVLPFHSFLQADIEASYTRMSGDERDEEDSSVSGTTETLELIPLSALVEARYALTSGELFAGLGPAITPFKALHSPNEDNDNATATVGTKIALEVRVGFRVDTGMIQAPIAPVSGKKVSALDLEVYAGRRHQFHLSDEGYDLGAWRAGAGLALRF